MSCVACAILSDVSTERMNPLTSSAYMLLARGDVYTTSYSPWASTSSGGISGSSPSSFSTSISRSMVGPKNSD